MNLYTETITNYAKNPVNYIGNRGAPDASYLTVVGKFPSCSENLILFLKVDDSKIQDIKWNGSGSAILVASASITSQHLIGKTLEQAKHWADAVFEAFSGIRAFQEDQLGKMIELQTVKDYPRRVRSAILPAHTIKIALGKLKA